MSNRQPRPLPPSAKEAFELLREEIHATDGYPHQQAIARLREAGFPEREAADTLDRLLQRGYLYAVDDDLYVTTPEVDLDVDLPADSRAE